MLLPGFGRFAAGFGRVGQGRASCERRRAAAGRGRTGPWHGHTRRGPYQQLIERRHAAARLRVVDDAESGEPAEPPQLAVAGSTYRPAPTPAVAEPAATFAVVATDRQARASVRRLLAELGWPAGAQLHGRIDRQAGVLWLQPDLAAVGTDLDGAGCDCGRCREQASPPPIPATVSATFEHAEITAKGELKLTRGLLSAVGAELGDQLLVAAVPKLDALAVRAAAGLLDAVFASSTVAASDAAVMAADLQEHTA